MSNEAKAQAPEKKAPEVGEMRKGDYMIHVYIQEGKQFKGDNNELVAPMIQISCGGKNKYTSCKKDVAPTSNVYWGEHLFFERNNVTKNEIESSQISIRVLNKGFMKDQLLGSYDFDITFVYFQDKHTLFNSWIALSNPEGKDFNEITCYLKIGISVAGPGDEQVALNDETGSSSTEEQEIMMPPSIRKEYKQLKIRFVKAEKLPKMDKFGTIDAYIQTVYFKKKLQTQAVTQTKSQETFLEQEFWLPIQWPLASDRLVLKVFDKDQITDEIVGSMNFSLKKLITESSNAEGVLNWHNLYGSPLECKGENTDRMNNYPEVASTWKGRILMHVQTFDTKNPEMKVTPLDAEFKNKCVKEGAYNQEEFQLIAEFVSGICLPSSKKYKVRIQINDFYVDSQEAIEAKGTYNRWSFRTPVTTFKGPYKSIQELGRLYVYLLDGDDAVCFWQGYASDFVNPNAEVKWIPLQCDLSKGKVTKSYEAGLVSVKIAINQKKFGVVNYSQYDAWKKPPPKRLSSYKIRCFIFQCKDIPSADSDGASDPYITIWNPDNRPVKTQTIEDNINPIFFEALEIYYDYDTLKNAPPIVLNIWDKDDMLDADDYLGRSVVYLNQASLSNDDTIPEPKWHDIRLGFSDQDPPCGQMLVSFSVVPDDYSFKIPLTYLKLTEEIQYNDFNCEINILGLRNLESFGLMPVKKPFIKFNLRSLLPPEKAQAVTNIKTQPSAAGSNPNINTMISFQIDLPVNPLFCPKLQCDVYDYVYKGLVQPLLGTFTLSIGDIMHQIKKDREEFLNESDAIIKYLKQLADDMDKVAPLMIQDQNDQKVSLFEERVQGLNQIAEDQEDTHLRTESQADKQRLIEGSSSIAVNEDDVNLKFVEEKDEEQKALLDNQQLPSQVLKETEQKIEDEESKSGSPSKMAKEENDCQ